MDRWISEILSTPAQVMCRLLTFVVLKRPRKRMVLNFWSLRTRLHNLSPIDMRWEGLDGR